MVCAATAVAVVDTVATRLAPLVATTSHATLAAVEAVASVEHNKRFFTSLT